MRKILSYGVIFMLGIGLILMSNCSEKATTPTTEGTPEGDEFEMMSDVSDIGLDALKIALDLSDTVMAMGGVTKPLFKAHRINAEVLTYNNLSYTYSNYWHIFGFTAKLVKTEGDQTDSMIVSGVDSLRFRNGGVLVQYPDEINTDELDVRQHINMNAYGADGGQLLIKDHASVNVTSESFGGDVINLNGAVNDSVEVAMDEGEIQLMLCEISMTSTQTFDDLIIDDTEECPTSGTVGMSAAVDIFCEGEEGSLTMESLWVATYFFDNGTVTIDVYSNGQHWQSSDPCGGV